MVSDWVVKYWNDVKQSTVEYSFQKFAPIQTLLEFGEKDLELKLFFNDSYCSKIRGAYMPNMYQKPQIAPKSRGVGLYGGGAYMPANTVIDRWRIRKSHTSIRIGQTFLFPC